MYSRNDLPYGRHTFRLTPIGGANVAGSSVVLFDNAVITYVRLRRRHLLADSCFSTDEPDPTSSSTAASPTTTSTTTVTPLPNPSSSVPIAAIIGGVVGAVVALSVVALVFWLLRRRRRYRHPQLVEPDPSFPLADLSSAWNGGDDPVYTPPVHPPSSRASRSDKKESSTSDLRSGTSSSSQGGSRSGRGSRRGGRDSVVQNLRREVEELRARVLQNEEAPPLYQA